MSAPEQAKQETDDCPHLVEKRKSPGEQVRIALCQLKRFNRRLTTPWTAKEITALKKILPLEAADWLVLKAYYDAEIPEAKDYRRRDIQTLLNNFPSEVDRARRWQATQKATSGRDYSKI